MQYSYRTSRSPSAGHRPLFLSALVVLWIAGTIWPITAHGLQPVKVDVDKLFGGPKVDAKPPWDATDYHDSPFGLMYLMTYRTQHQNLNVPRAYQDIGAKWIKFQRIEWQGIEPQAPSDGVHHFDWAILDRLVFEWQKIGYNIQFEIDWRSSWAMREVTHLEGVNPLLIKFNKKAPTIPKPEHWVDFEYWLAAMAERYDCDGKDDMPGLKFPIHYYEFGNEYQSAAFFLGTAEQYGEILRHGRKALLEADSRARIIHYGVVFNGINSGNVPDSVIARRRMEQIKKFPGVGKDLDRAWKFIEKTLTYTDLYDAVDIHANSTVDAMIYELLYLKRRLKELGAEDKEIWIGDSLAGPPLVKAGAAEYKDYAPRRGKQLYRILGQPRHKEYSKVKTWYLEKQACIGLEKYVVALAMGVKRINLGNLEDWTAMGGLNKKFQYHGLREATFPFRGPVVYGAPRPIYHTYRLMAKKLEGFRSVERLSGTKNQFLYRFLVRGKPVYVLWVDDGRLRDPNEAGIEEEVILPMEGKEVLITPIITKIGQEKARSRRKALPGGKLEITLTERPVFVEPI